MPVKKLTLMALLTTLLLIQEQALSFIPNVQFSTLLILLFASTFKLRDSLFYLRRRLNCVIHWSCWLSMCV